MTYQFGSVDPDENGYPMQAGGPGEAARPRGRGVLISALALGVMVVFAAGLWAAYVQGTRQAPGGEGDVPLIRADEHPTKMKPEQAGGMDIPDRDMLIYQQAHPAVERLLPPPETPLPRPTPPPIAAVTPAEPTAPSPPAAVPAPELPAPQQVATAALQLPAPAANPAAAKPAPVAAGGLRLQLGALRSEDVAQREWQKIKHANADLVGQLSATVVRADLPDKGVLYRIQTTPIADPISGALLCDELNRRNVGCVIAR
jgi:cell division septation protein DedD